MEAYHFQRGNVSADLGKEDVFTEILPLLLLVDVRISECDDMIVSQRLVFKLDSLALDVQENVRDLNIPDWLCLSVL